MHTIYGKERDSSDISGTQRINPYTNNPYSDNYYKILDTRQELPAYREKDDILKKVRENQVIIIEGQTGSGKTTQIPQFILNSDICPEGKSIVCTQPRRVAAINVANRVAEEMDVECGKVVGYCVRYDHNYTKDTKLIYMTDGMLMNEFTKDPMIRDYGVVIIDEAHERTVNTDIILGLLKNLRENRNDLKIIVMSATLDAEKFRAFFKERDIDIPHIKVEGKLFKVDEYYEPAHVSNYENEVIKKVNEICLGDIEGDILVFMTGQENIERTSQLIRERIMGQNSKGKSKKIEAEVLPLYAQLNFEEQKKVFRPLPGKRKIVISTNIAETSVTIDGIVFVIDCGKVKETHYDPISRKNSLIEVNISKASAQQRKGRAGRTREGICYRLYTEEEFERMEEQPIPEIQRTDIADIVLRMLAAHVRDIVHFPFPDGPHYKLLVGALEELYHLQVFREYDDVDLTGNRDELSEIGHMMSKLSVVPKYSRALLAAADYNCSKEVCIIVAILSEQGSILERPAGKRKEAEEAHSKFEDKTSDHLTFLQAFNLYKKYGKDWARKSFVDIKKLMSVDRTRKQLEKVLRNLGKWSEEEDDPSTLNKRILISFLTGSFMQVARRKEDSPSYTIAINEAVAEINNGSSVKTNPPKWVLFDEFSTDSLRNVSSIEPIWLIEASASFFDPNNFKDPNVREDIIQAIREYDALIHK